MSYPRNSCGKHTELVVNAAVRITQCSCGTIHATFHANGVTLKLTDDAFKSTTAAFLKASDVLEESAQPAIN